jgi:uroporphyrinogen decarboxylase
MMTSEERFARMFEHREADRVPIIDSPWAGTLRRIVERVKQVGAY